MFNKIEGKITNAKIEKGVEKLKKTSVDDLARQLENIDREELRKKISELDTKKIKDLNINIEAIKRKLSQDDIDKIKKLAGNDKELIMKKLDELT